MRKIVIGVMGPGEGATPNDLKTAYELGQRIAQEGWVLLTGGRSSGVMEAASQGAKAANGLTIGILPNETTKGMSEAVDIAIVTDLGNARNTINVLSSDVVIACGMGTGTASEISLALKANKNVILLNVDDLSQRFFMQLANGKLSVALNVSYAIAKVNELLKQGVRSQTSGIRR